MPSAVTCSSPIQIAILSRSAAWPDLPTAMTRRPQLASSAASAVFTSGELPMASAMAFAAWSSAAPVTVTSTNLVAPSPSRTICWARSSSTASSACWNATSFGSFGSASSSSICSPVAKSSTVSLVDVSESTVMRLKLRSTDVERHCWSSVGSTGRSVKTKASIVAMSGAIMPLPLAMPTTWLTPPSIRRAEPLAKVSVVRMASADAAHASGEAAPTAPARAGRLERRRSSGIGSPITPVEATKISSGSTPSWSARVSTVT